MINNTHCGKVNMFLFSKRQTCLYNDFMAKQSHEMDISCSVMISNCSGQDTTFVWKSWPEWMCVRYDAGFADHTSN